MVPVGYMGGLHVQTGRTRRRGVKVGNEHVMGATRRGPLRHSDARLGLGVGRRRRLRLAVLCPILFLLLLSISLRPTTLPFL